jgi:DNA-binding MarR family transcriptional regulator
LHLAERARSTYAPRAVSDKFEDDVLRALRRISRAIDLHSRQLSTTFGLTVPQLVCLRVIGLRTPISPSQLASEVSLSQATITGIVDRLVARQLVLRERSTVDRRGVTLVLSDAGLALVQAAPSPLQERFVAQLAELSPEEREIIRLTLNKIVRLMGGDTLDAAPLLTHESVLSPPPDPDSEPIGLPASELKLPPRS